MADAAWWCIFMRAGRSYILHIQLFILCLQLVLWKFHSCFQYVPSYSLEDLFFHRFSAEEKYWYFKFSNFSASKAPLCFCLVCSVILSHLLSNGGRGRKYLIGPFCSKICIARTAEGLVQVSEIIKESSSHILGVPDKVTSYWTKTSHGKNFKSGLCLPHRDVQEKGQILKPSPHMQ